MTALLALVVALVVVIGGMALVNVLDWRRERHEPEQHAHRWETATLLDGTPATRFCTVFGCDEVVYLLDQSDAPPPPDAEPLGWRHTDPQETCRECRRRVHVHGQIAPHRVVPLRIRPPELDAAARARAAEALACDNCEHETVESYEGRRWKYTTVPCPLHADTVLRGEVVRSAPPPLSFDPPQFDYPR